MKLPPNNARPQRGVTFAVVRRAITLVESIVVEIEFLLHRAVTAVPPVGRVDMSNPISDKSSSMPPEDSIPGQECTSFNRVAFFAVKDRFKVQVMCSAVVEMLVTPADPNAMLITMVPILAGMIFVYVYAFRKCLDATANRKSSDS